MLRWTDRDQIPAGFGPSVVTLGNFDGVHRGHQDVLRRMVGLARQIGGRAVAVTFSPHPALVHRPEQAPELLLGEVDRLELLEATGIDATLVLRYDLELASLTPRQFVLDHLVRPLNTTVVVVGRDVRFGVGNSGDLSTMVELGHELGFEVDVVPDRAFPEGERRWSSSWVREMLAAGDVRGAAEVLGRPHRLRGTVVQGDRRGRELGFPTANLGAEATGMVPADGVYAGWLRVLPARGAPAESAPRLPAAVSVGTNPTFGGAERRVEAHVLGREDLELYDREVLVELLERLRPTERFDSVEALVAQMHEDVARAARLLGSGGTGRN